MNTSKTIAFTFLFLLLSFSHSAFSQDKNIPTLQTEGTGELKTSPDWTVVYMEVSAKNMNFNKAVEELNKKYSILEKELNVAGFPKTDIRTQGYTIDKNIIYGQMGAIDSGFIARQNFVLEFSNDQAKIVKLVKAFTDSKTNLTYNFSFTLSEQKRKQTSSELIKKAMTDANEKSKLLSTAAGVTLKRIVNIKYGVNDFNPPPMATFKEARMNEDFSGFNVKDLELRDSVTITWEIAQP
jgi:uncharacterized protein